MHGETLLELRPRDILARRRRRRRCGEGGIFVDTAALIHQVRIARRQPFILIAAPRALQFLSDQRAQTRDRGLKCLVERSFILWSGVVASYRTRQGLETQLLGPILAGREQLAHVGGELVPRPGRPSIPT